MLKKEERTNRVIDTIILQGCNITGEVEDVGLVGSSDHYAVFIKAGVTGSTD